MKILNIEDNVQEAETMAKLLKKVANDTGLEVINVGNLSEALNATQELKANVTFMDLGIPMVAGGPILPWQEVVTYIKQILPPVIVVSGMDINANNFEIKFECIRQGAVRVFEKPFASKLISWMSSDSAKEAFAERLLDVAGAAHLRHVLQNGVNGK